MDPNNMGIDPHLAYFLPFFGLFALIGIAIYIIPFWMIFKKAGFTPWLALLLFIPLANIIILYVLAFSQWKVAPVAQLTGYPPTAYPPAYPPAAYPPAAPPANPNDIYPRT
ncbi:MAG TPA: hypothetical protein VF018_05885 [Acidobacteriaceae bacterium]